MSLSRLWALTRRETLSLLLTPTMYAVMAAVTVLYGFVFYQMVASDGIALFDPIAQVVGVMSIFLVPVLTMRAFAGERTSGTIEVLLTTSVAPLEVVLSKFFATMAFFLLGLLPCVAYAGLLGWAGDVDDGVVLTGLLGLALLGAAYASVGLFFSSLTGSLIVAAASACAAICVFFMLAYPVEQGASVYSFPAAFSFWAHFKSTCLRGLLDLRSLTALVSYPVYFLFLTWLVTDSRGLLSRPRAQTSRFWRFLAGLAAAGAVNVALFWGYVPLASDYPGSAFSGLWRGGFWMVMWKLVPFILGGLLAAGSAVCLGRGRLRGQDAASPVHDRWILRAWPPVLAAVSALVVLVNVNLLVLRVPVARDMTEQGLNTLSADTIGTLAELSDPCEITVFYSEAVNYQDVPLLDKVRELLTRYTSRSPLVRVQYYDAIRDDLSANRAARELKLEVGDLQNAAVATYQGRMLVLPAGLLLEEPGWREKMSGIKTPSFRGELAFTSAIKRLMDPKSLRVYVATGHGEMDSSDAAEKPGAAGMLAKFLRLETFDVLTYFMSDQAPVPDDCDVLMLLAPKVPYSPAVVEKLKTFVNTGGRLLVLLPPGLESRQNEAVRTLEPLFGIWGVEVRHDLVTDAKNCADQVPTNLYTVSTENAKGLLHREKELIALMPHARSIEFDDRKAADNGWSINHLLATTPNAVRQWRGKDGAEHENGPFSMAVYATRNSSAEHRESRMILVGNAAMADNMTIGKVHNRPLMIAMIQWLAGRDYRVRIEERPFVDRSFSLGRGQLTTIWWVALVALPELWALAGVLVWWLRRE